MVELILDPVSIIGTNSDNLEDFVNWVKELSQGLQQFGNIEKLSVDMLALCRDDVPIKRLTMLALAAASIREDATMAELNDIPIEDITIHRRRVEFIDNLLDTELKMIS